MPGEKLLFIDTNIWLDFYRARNDTGLKLLKQVEALTDNLIVTYQLESEYKRNRQAVLMESWDNLKPPTDLGFPNIVAEAMASKMLAAHMKEAKKRVARVRSLIAKAMTTQLGWALGAVDRLSLGVPDWAKNGGANAMARISHVSHWISCK
jgi:hypothetical protein